ncbi:MAG TPA: 23S rRNA (guanosine(2251)-2'-O)-methyltransferase RlmB [Gammaproteobacteria bacterium]|nr:23S rRNA (guanosine(2251)-2'-O)-methyltransferase RlmB [Gammaproteobacteria bacterium]
MAHTLYGLHAVQAALERAPHSVIELWVDAKRHDRRMEAILHLAEAAGIPVHTADKPKLDNLAPQGRHQGVVASAAPPRTYSEAELEALLERLDGPPFLLILDGVTDPHNLGACLRSADAAGVQAVIVPKDRAATLTPTAIKVASGAAQTVPFVQVTNLARTLRSLKERGIWLVGLDGHAEQTLYDTDLKGPLALVMGAEGQGLRRLSKEHCDYLVKIPMAGTVESLNVSVATGVCLYEALRQNHA